MTVTALSRKLAKRGLRAGSSAVVRVLGRDSTDELSGKASLVLAPHPDDETLGCGAAIARMRSRGTAVHVVFVSDGGLSPRPAGMSRGELVAVRRAEARRALELLGVGDCFATFWDFEDGNLSHQVEAVGAKTAEFLRINAPQQVFVTSAHDRHPDHVAVALAARAAVAAAGQLLLHEYPVWQRFPAATVVRHAARAMSVRDRSRGPRPLPVPRLVRTDGFIGVKRRALDVYESQLPHLPVGFLEDFMLPHEAFTEIRVSDGPAGGPVQGQ